MVQRDGSLVHHRHRGGDLRDRQGIGVEPMVKYIAIAALVALLGLSGALWVQSARIGTLQDANALLTRNAAVQAAQIEQARLAASVAAAHAQREREMNADTSAKIEAIMAAKGSCLDEILDPDLADIIGRGDVPAED